MARPPNLPRRFDDFIWSNMRAGAAILNKITTGKSISQNEMLIYRDICAALQYYKPKLSAVQQTIDANETVRIEDVSAFMSKILAGDDDHVDEHVIQAPGDPGDHTE